MEKLDELRKEYANKCAMLGDAIFNALIHFKAMTEAQERYKVLSEAMPKEEKKEVENG